MLTSANPQRSSASIVSHLNLLGFGGVRYLILTTAVDPQYLAESLKPVNNSNSSSTARNGSRGAAKRNGADPKGKICQQINAA
jgi:hypothetical protein